MENNIDARIKRSRASIINAGMKLFNKNSEASLSDIAIHAGVGRATLYRLFDTKESLIKAIAFDCLETFDGAMKDIEFQASSTIDAIRLVFTSIMPCSDQLIFLMNLDHISNNDPELVVIHDRQKKEVADLIDLAKGEGLLNKTQPTSWMINVIDGLFYSACLMKVEHNYSDEEVAELAFQTLLNGIKS